VSVVNPVSLFGEFKRRRVFRALIGYGIAAFAVLQIVEPIMHALHWPDAVLSYVVVALAVGFPIVVALAWIFDCAGLKRTTNPGARNRALPVHGRDTHPVDRRLPHEARRVPTDSLVSLPQQRPLEHRRHLGERVPARVDRSGKMGDRFAHQF